MVRAQNFHRTLEDVAATHKASTLEEYVLDAHNINECGNLLDLQNLSPQLPTWMK
jgi:hypothetical protein